MSGDSFSHRSGPERAPSMIDLLQPPIMNGHGMLPQLFETDRSNLWISIFQASPYRHQHQIALGLAPGSPCCSRLAKVASRAQRFIPDLQIPSDECVLGV